MPHGRPWWALTLLTAALTMALAKDSKQQAISNFERARALDILNVVESDLKHNYYDPKFNGTDLDARFAQAREKIRAENSLNHALSDIAGAMAALRDSHTFFVPPPRPYKHSYGWHMTAVGDSDCYITAVRPGSDAETRGIRPGDQVLTVNGFPANREDAWTINYIFNTLRPQMTLQLELRSPQGVERKLDVNARFEPTQRLVPYVDIWALIREQENREWPK